MTIPLAIRQAQGWMLVKGPSICVDLIGMDFRSKKNIFPEREDAMTMGRPRSFEGPTTKVSVVVPTETARTLRILAAEQGVSIAQLVDEWTRKARLLKAVERGRRALAEGDVVTHEEAGRRLKKWASS